jgi:hypothetical protein
MLAMASDVVVKPHAFGVPLKRFQGLSALPRQAWKEVMQYLPKDRFIEKVSLNRTDTIRTIEC